MRGKLGLAPVTIGKAINANYAGMSIRDAPLVAVKRSLTGCYGGMVGTLFMAVL